jgi:hypothetical protein
MWAVSFTSLLFILLQSACTAAIVFGGFSTVLGLGSLAAALGLTRLTGRFHSDAIRIPMMVLALAGSLINLYVLWRVRALRARPASQWRVRPVTSRQRRAELFQLSLSIITILLVLAEGIAHQAMYHVR